MAIVLARPCSGSARSLLAVSSTYGELEYVDWFNHPRLQRVRRHRPPMPQGPGTTEPPPNPGGGSVLTVS